MSSELYLTFVHNSSPTDVVVPLPTGTGDDLYRAAEKRYGTVAAQTLHVERSGDLIERTSTLSELDVLTGDRIVVGSSGGTSQSPKPGPTLVVVEGPSVGRRIQLRAGRTEVGRGEDGPHRIRIDGPTVSRHHAAFSCESNSVKVSDLGSTNGTEVNGSPITTETVLYGGDHVQIGETVLRVEFAEGPGSRRHLTQTSGWVSFNREPRVLAPDPARVFDLEPPPQTPQKRRFPLPAAVVPVMMGVLLFVVLGSPYFLMMAAVGPVMVIWTTIDDRRSGRKDFAKARDRYLSKVAGLREQVESTRSSRAAWLNERHPPTSELVERSLAHNRRLWRKRLRDDDFLALRVGLGTMLSPSSIRLPQSGDDDLREVAEKLQQEFATEPETPVTVSLTGRPILGLVQKTETLGSLARAFVTQVVAEHSPRDVGLAVLAPSHSEEWEFAKWLPHVKALGEEIRLVADGDEQAKTLFGVLRRLAEQRRDAAEEAIGTGRFSPHVLVVIHPPARLPRREVTEFLEQAAEVGFSVLWIDNDRAGLPGECSTVIHEGPNGVSVTFTDSGSVQDVDSPEAVDATTLGKVARSLAPLVDVSSGADATIPTRADLLELMEMHDISSSTVLDSWGQARKGLEALIGADADGPVRFEWRRDGPHALVAGTTGAGKSELLQSLVASMAVLHPPTRVNFVLIDYKGGSAFKDCVDLPHTVGMVTDLDEHLAERALTSLRAELRYREHLFNDHGAKDIVEMTAKGTSQAPPNLLIIIDEFAALKNEVPEFVDGVIDIAQRGRSLGVHLLLATQQPSGVIDPKIQGNTNLRIALRVADQGDSVDVIGRPDATQISRSVPGRGFIRMGPTDVTEFQSAYVGGTSTAEVDPVAVTFAFGIEERAALAKAMSEGASTTSVSDLQRLVAATRDAASLAGIPMPRLPWVDPLPEVVPYRTLAEVAPPGRRGMVVGMADLPDEQSQSPYCIDLDQHANVLILGSSGAGKTSFLRTVATDLAIRYPPDDVWIYGLDYASRGLGSLEQLPHCGGVIYSNDLDRTRRLLEILTRMAVERREELGGAGSPSEYEVATGNKMPSIVVLIDGFGQLWEALDGIDRSEHLSRLASLFADARSVGMSFAITADRRLAVPPNIASMISARFIMRMADPDEYLNFGLPKLARSAPPKVGRAFTPDGVELQVAVLHRGDKTSAASQGRVIEEIASRLPVPTRPVPKPALLPETVDLHQLESARGLLVPVGIEEANLDTAWVDFADAHTFAVFGPDRSGRSTALMTLAKGLERSLSGAYLLAGRSSPLADLNMWDRAATGTDQVLPVADLLRERFEERNNIGSSGKPILVAVEDGDDFDQGPVEDILDLLVRRGRDAGFIVVSSMTTFAGTKTYAKWCRSIRANRTGLLLQPNLEDDGDLFGIRLPQRSGLVMPEGRGFLVTRTQMGLVHIAMAH